MRTWELIYTGLMLVSMFAALLWMKPGKREAARYGMVLVPYGGLLYLLQASPLEMGEVGYYLLHHLLASAALLVFLLGVFMLNCPWKRVLRGCGVYALVHVLHAPLYVLYTLYFYGSLEPLFHVLRAAPGRILMTWLFVWLCARPLSAKQGLLTAATIEVCQSLVFSNVARYIPLLFGLGVVDSIALGSLLNVLIWMLAFVLIVRHLLEKSWKRSIAFSFSPLVLAFVMSLILLIIKGVHGTLLW